MNKIYTSQELRAIQQPLSNKTGYSNPQFDKLYGHKAKNPFHGTERDVVNKKNYPIGRSPKYGDECDNCNERAEYSSKVNGLLEWKLCAKCYHNKNE
jgi:hypothetical protein